MCVCACVCACVCVHVAGMVRHLTRSPEFTRAASAGAIGWGCSPFRAGPVGPAGARPLCSWTSIVVPLDQNLARYNRTIWEMGCAPAAHSWLSGQIQLGLI